MVRLSTKINTYAPNNACCKSHDMTREIIQLRKVYVITREESLKLVNMKEW